MNDPFRPLFGVPPPHKRIKADFHSVTFVARDNSRSTSCDRTTFFNFHWGHLQSAPNSNDNVKDGCYQQKAEAVAALTTPFKGET